MDLRRQRGFYFLEATRLRRWAVEESYFLEFMYPFADFSLLVSMSFLMVPRAPITSSLELLVAWLALTSVNYHRNVWVSILLNQWLAIAMLPAIIKLLRVITRSNLRFANRYGCLLCNQVCHWGVPFQWFQRTVFSYQGMSQDTWKTLSHIEEQLYRTLLTTMTSIGDPEF